MSRFNVRPRSETNGLSTLAHGGIVAALIILLFVVGREILEPLVIAALLAFILSPLIRRLRSVGMGRVPSVILTVLMALALLGALSTTIGLQITQLAQELPTYERNLREKIRALGAGTFTSGALDRASGTLKDLQEEITKAGKPSAAAPAPMVVEVRTPDPKGLESIAALVRPLLSPLAMTALVILFLVFILLHREDIRDRMLRLAGTADLQRSTAALDDAGVRLSRFFLMQTLLNTGFGIFIAGSLLIIGVPNAILWGIFAGLMRFVPVVGSLIAAFFPIALAAAVEPGWTMAITVAGLFLIAEPLAGHVIEPVVYGQHTGLSPVAIVLATLFWTIIWGPVGLLLATPLTVCLVVLGRHIEALQFIEILLGDEPALEPHERFYQRLLAGDDAEAADMAEVHLKVQSLCEFYDAVVMPALALAQTDAARGKLSRDRQAELRNTMQAVIGNLSDEEDKSPAAIPLEDSTATPSATIVGPVVCIAARSALDEAACLMLAQVLTKSGMLVRVVPLDDVATARLVEAELLAGTPLVCLSYFGSEKSPAHVRYLTRRLRRSNPKVKLLASFWMLRDSEAKAEEWRVAAAADLVAVTLRDAVDKCVEHGMRAR